jgi:methionyl-tRNA synthetase
VLFHAAESLRLIAVLVAPVIPKTAQNLWEQLGLDGSVTGVRLDDLHWNLELVGKTVRGGPALFPRLDPKEVLKKMDSVSEQKAEVPPQPAATAPVAAGNLAPQITIDDFTKVDLRVATVVEAERVKGADKLLRLVVDLGFEKRQILAGIALAYQPESLIGRKVVIVANLQPRKLRGLESNGMIVAASLGPEDKPVLVAFHEDVENGARLK